MVGTSLGPYQVLSKLGEGGMGEVYRAHDTRLNRQVAIKILSASHAGDPERVARFHREAQAVAAFNHPHIAQIYEVEEGGSAVAPGGTTQPAPAYLVLELVEGETLADRIKGGPIRPAEALRIGGQILDALEVAHERGICHRDLKPANVKLTVDGNVKVLDFGLARIMPTAAAQAQLSNSPTLSLAATMAGVILGTAAYMSPEQAKGLQADQRSDIFSFGCVLFEMLTGRQPFDGDSASEVLAAVLKTDPDYTALPARLNPQLVEVLRRCLEKNPKNRWHSAADVRVQLDAIAGRETLSEDAASAIRRLGWVHAAVFAVGLVAAFAIGGYTAWRMKPAPAQKVQRFLFPLPDGQRFSGLSGRIVGVSPGGESFVYVANARLYVRSLDEVRTTAIAGTEVFNGMYYPVFSPDGRELIFFATGERAIKRVALRGGPVMTVCQVNFFHGMSWSEHGIVFAEQGKGVLRVSANGGTPEVVAVAAAGEVAASPQLIDRGRAVLFTAAEANAPWDAASIVVQPIGGARKTILEGAADARLLPTGHLLYARAGVLYAAAFDAGRLEIVGHEAAVLQGVGRAGTVATGRPDAHFAVSHTGLAVYLPGPIESSRDVIDLVLFDGRDNVQPLKMPPQAYRGPRVSPDSRFVTYHIDGPRAAVWVYELAGRSPPRQLTLDGNNRWPIWSGDGHWIAFQSNREGSEAIYRQRADGVGRAERLTSPAAGVSHVPQDWSRDGQHLLFSVLEKSEYSLAVLSLKTGTIEPFGGVRSSEMTNATFSPDGDWIAYQSRETNRRETYLQPFPADGTRFVLPNPNANLGAPFWSRDGKQILANSGPVENYAVTVTTTPQVTFGHPALTQRIGHYWPNPNLSPRFVDVLGDGRFIGVGLGVRDPTPAEFLGGFIVVTNWFEELQRLLVTP